MFIQIPMPKVSHAILRFILIRLISKKNTAIPPFIEEERNKLHINKISDGIFVT